MRLNRSDRPLTYRRIGQLVAPIWIVVALLAVLVAFTSVVSAGEIRIRATGPDGAPAAGVTVDATHESSGTSRWIVTDDDGKGELRALVPGRWTLAVSGAGFGPHSRTLTLAEDESFPLALELDAAAGQHTEPPDTVAAVARQAERAPPQIAAPQVAAPQVAAPMLVEPPRPAMRPAGRRESQHGWRRGCPGDGARALGPAQQPLGPAQQPEAWNHQAWQATAPSGPRPCHRPRMVRNTGSGGKWLVRYHLAPESRRERARARWAWRRSVFVDTGTTPLDLLHVLLASLFGFLEPSGPDRLETPLQSPAAISG